MFLIIHILWHVNLIQLRFSKFQISSYTAMALVGAKTRLNGRILELSKKNDEYSKMVQRLLKTVDQEKKIHEKRIAELMRDSENQLRDVQVQCRDEQLELIARNVEMETQLKALLDNNNGNHFHEATKLVQHLEMGLVKATHELENKMRALAVKYAYEEFAIILQH